MPSFRSLSGLATAVAGVLFAPLAHSHITFLEPQAAVAAGYRAALRVPHGCEGSPTTAIRVQIPEGVIGVKPQPKAGWTLELVKGDYARSHTQYGKEVSAGVKEIVWSGGSLPDEHYDEFVFVGYLSDALEPGKKLYFPVVQQCEQGEAHWTRLPADAAPPGHGHAHGAPTGDASGHAHAQGHGQGHGHGHASAAGRHASSAPAITLLPRK